MNKTRLLIDACAVLLAFSILGFAITDASEDYKVTKELFKPLLVGIQATAYEVKIENWDLKGGFNVHTLRYENITVIAHNIGNAEITATVQVQLWNATNTVIASGQKQMVIYANSTFNVNIPLVWKENKTYIDYSHGQVTVS